MLTELNPDCVMGEADARQTLGVCMIGVIELHTIFYESAKLKYDETKTYAYKFPIGNPDVWYAPDLHKSRSKHIKIMQRRRGMSV
jgi:hypothetical protein